MQNRTSEVRQQRFRGFIRGQRVFRADARVGPAVNVVESAKILGDRRSRELASRAKIRNAPQLSKQEARQAQLAQEQLTASYEQSLQLLPRLAAEQKRLVELQRDKRPASEIDSQVKVVTELTRSYEQLGRGASKAATQLGRLVERQNQLSRGAASRSDAFASVDRFQRRIEKLVSSGRDNPRVQRARRLAIGTDDRSGHCPKG